jgi:hypothetical protein
VAQQVGTETREAGSIVLLRQRERTMRLALLSALGLAACSGSADRKPAEPPGADLAGINFAPSLSVDLGSMTRTPRGAFTRDLTPGTGAPVGPGQQVAIHYESSLANDQPFDANGATDPLSCSGWGPARWCLDLMRVAGMRVGGQRQVIIPPALGYGSQANGPIPANSVLVFTIELVSVK